jgi:HK97 family phage major capsid protein
MPEGLQYRFLQAAPSDLKNDGGERSLTVCFSSETPVLRCDDGGEAYYEVLDHDARNADLSLLQNGGAVVDEHNMSRQFAAVKRAWLDKDRKGRAKIIFGDIPLADERFELMSSGIRKDISFGYIQTKCLSTTRHADGKPLKRFAWKAYEISSVGVGADHFETGVGRGIEVLQRKSMNQNEIQTEMVALERSILHDRPDLENEIKQLHTRSLCAESLSLRDYKAAMRELLEENPRSNHITAVGGKELKAIRALNHEVGMSKKDLGEYSFSRAIRSAFENGGRVRNCFEADISQQVERNCGQSAEGCWIPSDVLLQGSRRDFQKRDLYTGDFTSGGAAVNPQMSVAPIELLRNKMICSRLGASYMAGLQGPLAIPRQTGTVTPQAVAEIAALTESQLSLDQVNLSPKRVGATTVWSKQLAFQSTPSIEALIQDDLLQTIAIKHDYLYLYGAGANDEPLGLLNTPGVNSVTFGGAPTYSAVVSFETALGTYNADLPPLAYASTPATKGVFKSTAVALQGATTVSSRSLWGDGNFADGTNDGIVNGYRAASTNQIPSDKLIFGRWSELFIGNWGGWDLVFDVITRAKNAECVLTANTWIDGALRHAQSFTVSADAGSQ